MSTTTAAHSATAGTAAVIMAVATGVTIALAPVVGVHLVAAVSGVWLLTVAAYLVLSVGHFARLDVAHALLLASTALAAVRLTSLGLVQVAGDRPTLFWNVDWRYTATHAQGIARFGDLSDSLDYAGAPVQYHVGPAWIAGALAHVASLPVGPILLIAVPLACVVVIAVSSYRLVRTLSVSATAAALATALLMSLPGNPYVLLRQTYGSFRGQAPLTEVLTNAEHWWFSPELMLNSLLALAVALSAASLLAGTLGARRSQWWLTALGGSGLGALIALKPQYAVGTVAVLALGLGVQWWRGERRPSQAVLVLVSAAATSLAATGLNHAGVEFAGIDLVLSTRSVQVAGTALLHEFSLLLVAAAVLAVVLGALRVRHARGSSPPSPAVTHAVGAVLGTLALLVLLKSMSLRTTPELIERAASVGLTSVTAQDENLTQALRPALAVVVLLTAGAALDVLLGARRRGMVLAVAALVTVTTLPLTVAPLARPSRGYEVAEESGLAAVMGRTDVAAGRWLTNDLADPADDFARPLRATSVTAFAPAQFYVSNVVYMGWTQPDVAERLTAVQRFFQTPWSPWHAEFLRSAGISHLALRDRCQVAWPPEAAGEVLGRAGSWTVVQVDPPAATAPDSSGSGSGDSPAQRYGLSACLDHRGPLT